jgi:hypothetical protein
MRGALLSLLVCIPLLAQAQDAEKKPAPAETPKLRLVFELSDGSRIVGTPAIDRLKIITPYAGMEVPLAMVRSIEFDRDKHTAKTLLQNGDLLNGRIDAANFALDTIFGTVTVPLDQARRVTVTGGGGGRLPEGLVLHYTFAADENGKVSDASGSGNDGVVQGGAWSGTERLAGAMNFSGDHQRIAIKNSQSLQLQDFTILAWVKLAGQNNVVSKTAWSGGGMVFGYGQGGYAFGFDGKGALGLTKVGIDGTSVDYGIRDNVYHHIGVTKKGARVVFYIDGAPRPANNYNTDFVFNTDVAVAARGDNNDSWFLGGVGETEVFNRVLSDDEVKAIYDSQKSADDVKNAAKPQPPEEAIPRKLID